MLWFWFVLVMWSKLFHNILNSLEPGDSTWPHKSGSTLAREMQHGTKPLPKIFFGLSSVRSSDNHLLTISRNTRASNYLNWLGNDLSKISFISHRGKWVNMLFQYNPGRYGQGSTNQSKALTTATHVQDLWKVLHLLHFNFTHFHTKICPYNLEKTGCWGAPHIACFFVSYFA